MKRLALAASAAFVVGTGAQATDLSIATGGTGGVLFPYGGGVAEIINRHIDGVTATAEVTGASVENLNLVATFEADIGMGDAPPIIAAFTGTGVFADNPFPEARTLLAIYPTVVQLVTLADSGIASIDDLRGQRVSVGAPGSGTEVSARTLLEANGITFDEFSAQRLNFNETADALRDGGIVAGFWSVGAPTSSIMNLAATRDIAIVPLTQEQIDAAIEVQPSFASYTMPAGTYDGMDEDVLTISTPNAMIVHADMDEDLVHDIARAVLENVETLIAIHPVAVDTTVDFTLNSSPIPLHPGTIRYLESIGHEVPDRLRP